ncbi:hypothetical protein [Aerosakkonema funiforme]|uniref:Uncharacterized protein n=1 Tax=Aerosakkonema funiforme FACHB-1375 TaxID=2949571 RepID=A0A926VA34_9CYAN|nr:hypothetical protein [Aerosakkonema funiforme]MBD2180002.1 hypothetical protein [Aerosakkonema funiforme FACHB-1375]
MELKFDASGKILDFLTLLKMEEAKENSDIFDPIIWQDLNQLADDLDAVNTADKIALTILRWCSKYPQINETLNKTNWSKFRIDMDDEKDGEIPPPDPTSEAEVIENKYEIQRIIKSQQPTTPQNNPQP